MRETLLHAPVAVWWATATDRPGLRAVLDPAERARLSRFQRAGDSRRYLTAHALVRLLLGPLVGATPAGLHFGATCRLCGQQGHGKPRLISLDPSSTDVSFSLAHSGDRVVVAVTGGIPVGVDVEQVVARELDQLDALSREMLSPTEQITYRALPVDARSQALITWWTRKEAVVKATGDGLGVPLAEISVTPPDQPAALVGWPTDRLGPHTAARPAGVLRDLRAPSGYVGCVAVIGARALEVTEHDADPLLVVQG